MKYPLGPLIPDVKAWSLTPEGRAFDAWVESDSCPSNQPMHINLMRLGWAARALTDVPSQGSVPGTSAERVANMAAEAITEQHMEGSGR
jgi:hypothetical protein